MCPAAALPRPTGLLLGRGVCSNPLYLQQEAKAAQQPMSLSRCQCDPARVTGMLCALPWVLGRRDGQDIPPREVPSPAAGWICITKPEIRVVCMADPCCVVR